MSNDRYQEIRDALEMGPTSGPWIVTHELLECDETVCDLVNGTWIVTAPGVKLAHWEHDAAHIAACNPDTIRELLAERDQLAAALEAAREDAWQPIETAPKDGTLVLLCRIGVTSTWPAWWRQRKAFDRRHKTGWHSSMNSPIKFSPTHWMPLPAPPKGARNG